jgi:hypothetical protein
MNVMSKELFGDARLQMAALLFLAFAFIAGPGCKKRSGGPEPPAAASAGTTIEAEVPAGEAARFPVLSFSVDGRERGSSYRGWPVEAFLEIYHPEVSAAAAAASPIVVSLVNEAKEPAARLDFRRADGRPAGASFKPVPAAEAAVTLDGSRTAMFVWWLDADSSATLPPGDYELTVTYDPGHDAGAGAWTDRPVLKKAFLRVEPEPADLSGRQINEKALAVARAAFMLGDRDEANRRVEELLAADPDDLSGLELKGDLALASGDKEAAFDVYGRAVFVFHRDNRGERTPGSLYRKYRALFGELMAPSKSADK